MLVNRGTFRRFLPSFMLVVGFTLAGCGKDPESPAKRSPSFPEPAWIADEADVLADQNEAALSKLLSDFHNLTTVKIVGVTVSNLHGLSVEEYTRLLANTWSVGTKGVNNGIVVLVVPKLRKCRIEIGYGMEWEVPDSKAVELIQAIIPYFKSGDFYQGLRMVFERLMELNDGVFWTVDYRSAHAVLEAGEKALGRIVTFLARLEQIQGNSAKGITEGMVIHINLVPHADRQALQPGRNFLFYGRVKSVQPFVVNSLGFQRSL